MSRVRATSMWVLSLPTRVFDFFFRRDFFISYRRADGLKYAIALHDRLESLGFDVFLDSTDYVKGDHWRHKGHRELCRSSHLILVGSPGVLESEPVISEMRTFVKLDRRIIPIDIDGVLAPEKTGHELFELLAPEILRLFEPNSALVNGPSEEIIDQIKNSFYLVKQTQRRLNWVIGIALTLAGLAAAASTLALLSVQQWYSAEVSVAKERAAIARTLALTPGRELDALSKAIEAQRAPPYPLSVGWQVPATSQDALSQVLGTSGRITKLPMNVGQAAWLNDGRWIVGGKDGRVCTNSDSVCVTLDAQVTAISAAGTAAVVGTKAGTIWRVAGTKRVELLTGLDHIIAVGSYGDFVVALDIEGRLEVLGPSTHSYRLPDKGSRLTVSHGWIVATDQSGNVAASKLGAGPIVWTSVALSTVAYAVAMDRGGDTVWVGTSDGILQQLSLPELKTLNKRNFGERIKAIAPGPEGLLVGMDAPRVVLVNPANGNVIRTYAAGFYSWNVRWLGADRFVMSTNNTEFWVVSALTGERLERLRYARTNVVGISVWKDNRVLVWDLSGHGVIWQQRSPLETGRRSCRQIKRARWHDGWWLSKQSEVQAPDGSSHTGWLLEGDGLVALRSKGTWSLKPVEPLLAFDAVDHTDGVSRGETVVTWSRSREKGIINATQRTNEGSTPIAIEDPWAITIDSQGQIIVGTGRGVVHVGDKPLVLTTGDGLVALDANEGKIVAGTYRGRVFVVDQGDVPVIRELTDTDKDPIRQVRLLSGGELMVVSHTSMGIWNTKLERRLSIKAPAGFVWRWAAAGPQDRFLICALDGTAREYDARPVKLREVACELLSGC